MNKKTFLRNLTIGLKALKIADISDVLKDYEGHFARESEKGKSEAEIAEELGDLDQILKDYSPESEAPFPKKAKAATLTGLIFLDVLMVLSAVLFYGIFLSFFTSSIVSGAVGIYYLFGLEGVDVFPILPTIILEVILGISLVAFGFLFGTFSIWYLRVISRAGKNYCHWHKCETTGLRLPIEITENKSILGKVVIVSGITALFAFVLFYVLAAVSANNLEFWHVWNWFR